MHRKGKRLSPRLATQSGNRGKQGKWSKQIPCMGKIREFQNLKKKSGNYQGILQNVKKCVY